MSISNEGKFLQLIFSQLLFDFILSIRAHVCLILVTVDILRFSIESIRSININPHFLIHHTQNKFIIHKLKVQHKPNFIINQTFKQTKLIKLSRSQMQKPELHSESQHQDFQDTKAKGHFSQELLQQYYKYLHLVKVTNNLTMDPSLYLNLTDFDYQNLALVGWVFDVPPVKIQINSKEEQQCFMPVVYSNISDPFYNYQENPKAKIIINQITQLNEIPKRKGQKPLQTPVQQKPKPLQPNLSRELLILRSQYKKRFFKVFNQILKQSKPVKKLFEIMDPTQPANKPDIYNTMEYIYAFTGLRLTIHNGKFVFVITENTRIIALDTVFYAQYIENLEKAIGFPYSYLNLTSMPKYIDPETMEEGYPLSALQTQASLSDRLSFTGILKEFQIESSNSKDKEVFMTFLQDSFHPKRTMIGLAKVTFKFTQAQSQEEIRSFFKIGFIYLVAEVTLTISNVVNFMYKLKRRWQDHFFLIDIQKSPDLTSQSKQHLPTIDLYWLKLANANRNIVKFRVNLVRNEHFYGKVVCTKCRLYVNSDGFCSGYCGKNEGDLVLWAIALVADETSYAEISMEKKEIIEFYELNHEHIDQIKKYILAQNSRKMIKIFDRFCQFDNSKFCDPLLSFQLHVATRFVQKTLLGISRYNLYETFDQKLNEDEKLEFQQCLQLSKEYMKKNKVHFNGYTKKIAKDKVKAVPFIKIMEVLED